MIKDPESIKKILFITLSNPGDVVLTTPVFTLLRKKFPRARIAVMVGPRAEGIFAKDPRVDELIIYDKSVSLGRKAALVGRLRKEGYELVVDLRNTLIPLLLGAPYCTGLMRRTPKAVKHKRDIHLQRLTGWGIIEDEFPEKEKERSTPDDNPGFDWGSTPVWVDREDRDYIEKFVNEQTGTEGTKIVTVCPGARNRWKRWEPDGFIRVIDGLASRDSVKIVLAGDTADEAVVNQIAFRMKNNPIVMAGKTSFGQLAALLERSALLITNDSAPLHLGSMLGIPVLALFGPTDPGEYGPLSKGSRVIRKDLSCSPCCRSECLRNHECMRLIDPEKVLETARDMLAEGSSS